MVKRISLIAIGLFLISAASAYASVFIPLVDVEKTGASGEAVVEKAGFIMPGERLFSLTAWKLKPNSIYTVWLANADGARRPVGVESNHFETDAGGKGRFVANIALHEFEDWQYILINHHPGKDPGNTENMVLALKGDIRYGSHY